MSGAYNSSEGGAYATGCYMKSTDTVYFWKNGTLRTWAPSTNTYTNFYNELPDYKLFIDVDGKLKGIYWYRSVTATVYTVTSSAVTQEYSINTTEWADEYTGNNHGFLPNADGIAYLVSTNTVIEFNLHTILKSFLKLYY